jgi:biopolymer transport protein ExbD
VKLLSKEKPEVDVDLTPMIDCIFNLLIFLMCINTISIIVGISIKVPKGPPQAPRRVEKQLKVCFAEDQITTGHKVVKEGVIKLNGVRVDLKNYCQILRHMRKRIPKEVLIIEAEKKVYHGKVVKIMDLTQKEILLEGAKKGKKKKVIFSFSPPVERIEEGGS